MPVMIGCGYAALVVCAGMYRAEFSHAPDGGPVIEDGMSWVNSEIASADFHVPTSFGTMRLVR